MSEPDTVAAPPPRKGGKPAGARKQEILQVLAQLLEDPRGEKITTALLAARLQVSEAALYRHFASKAQMFEGLIEFIEESIFGLINQICAQENDGQRQVRAIMNMLAGFAQANPGMTRVLIGDALLNENERLQQRMNQLYDRVELSLKQSLRNAITQGSLPAQPEPSARANLLLSLVLGRWHRFVKTGFKTLPSQDLQHLVI